MSSRRKIEANQNNSQLSTGPRTEEGKAVSSQNAVTHGLTSKTVVLSVEDRAAYEDLRAELVREYRPATTQELLLVTQIAENYFRLQRARNIETAMFERELYRESANLDQTLLTVWECRKHDIDLIRRYAKGFESAYYRGITVLRQLQKDRKKEEAARERGFVSKPKKTKRSSGSEQRPAPFLVAPHVCPLAQTGESNGATLEFHRSSNPLETTK